MPSPMWLIVGLGNPGKQYALTRHNLGFMVADYLAEEYTSSFGDHKGLTQLAKANISSPSGVYKTFLAKPLTFMNASGQAVASLAQYYDIAVDHLIVIHDDLDLEFGRIKLKKGGSAGGHNGIRSIDQSLGTQQYYRIRLGIGSPSRGSHDSTVDWVLGKFKSSDQPQLNELIVKAADATYMLLTQGLAKAQERIHGQ